MKEIMNFKPKEYWVSILEVLVEEKSIELMYENEEFSSKSEAKEILIAIKDQKSLKVVKISEQKHTIYKPKPMNTNDLIRMASNLFGFSSDKTKDIAERLYSKGYKHLLST